MELEICSERDGSVCVMVLNGEIDVYTAPQLKEALVEQIEAGCSYVVIDLKAVNFIDSSGLGVLVGGLRRTRECSGTIRLVCSQDSILKIFQITGLDKVFSIFDDIEEARQF